jgi:hypothetical protein
MTCLTVNDFKELSSHPSLLPIPDPADVNATEILNKVLETHPEGAITLLKVGFKLLNDFRIIPLRRFVAPGSIPFELTPRVSDIQ